MRKSSKPKRTYILVHGMFCGAWCWYKVVAGLEKAGQIVFAPDLPGMGIDRTPINSVTMDMWVKYIFGLIEKQTSPVILVGHSRGGLVSSQVVEYYPDRVEKLVYLASQIVKSGDSLLNNSLVDGPSPLLKYIEFAADGQSATLHPEAEEILCNNCSDEDKALTRLMLCAEPLAPVSTAISLSEAGYWRVPKVYITTLKDKMSFPEVQKKLYTWARCERIIEMNTDHMASLSAADELVQHLLSI